MVPRARSATATRAPSLSTHRLLAARRQARILLGAVALCLAARVWLAPAAFASPPQARRAALGAAASAALLGVGAGDVRAFDACRDGANNCFSTLNKGGNKVAPWKWPAGQSKADAVSSLTEVLKAYPQAGQADVDKGGWKIVVDELSSKGYARVEYTSGKGNLAMFFNFGQPFVDDLEVSFGDDSVSVKSSSRVGDSDFGVNAKRLNFIASGLRAKGWDAPGVDA
ncbi:unnamed protein product [Prorocentrum cordatum]|uniref:DUF1499 domain-containing protein n=1 Tax=Prorocentrum cordatum TaxID=2364126 RepID=A0ABN9PBQ2_9DINO|nr:unnamed protein product [Polarella glacialis]